MKYIFYVFLINKKNDGKNNKEKGKQNQRFAEIKEVRSSDSGMLHKFK